MNEYFAKPGVFETIAPTETAHHQLWNPELSGYISLEIVFEVMNCPGGLRAAFHGANVGMLDDATFSESRSHGLGTRAGHASEKSSSCSVRFGL